MSDGSEFLDIRMGDIKVPEILPPGVYRFVFTGYKLDREANDKRTPFVLANFRPVDVVESDAEVDVTTSKSISRKFYRTEAADPITADFFSKKLGMDWDDEALMGELWEEAIGYEVLGEVTNEDSKKNPDISYANIVKFFRAE